MGRWETALLKLGAEAAAGGAGKHEMPSLPLFRNVCPQQL